MLPSINENVPPHSKFQLFWWKMEKSNQLNMLKIFFIWFRKQKMLLTSQNRFINGCKSLAAKRKVTSKSYINFISAWSENILMIFAFTSTEFANDFLLIWIIWNLKFSTETDALFTEFHLRRNMNLWKIKSYNHTICYTSFSWFKIVINECNFNQMSVFNFNDPLT